MIRRPMSGLVVMLAPALLTGATTPSPPDVSGAILFSDASNCLYAPGTEATFTAMLHFDARHGTWLTRPRVTIGRLSLPTARTVAPSEDVIRGGKDYQVSVHFPAGTLWNGLRLAEIRRHEGYYPETDSVETRELVFLDSPARVWNAFKRLGASVPEAPDYLEIGEDGIGSMSVYADKTRTVVNCNWGA